MSPKRIGVIRYECRCQFCSADYELEIQPMDYYDRQLEAFKELHNAMGRLYTSEMEQAYWKSQGLKLVLNRGFCPYHSELTGLMVTNYITDREGFEQVRSDIIKDLECREND